MNDRSDMSKHTAISEHTAISIDGRFFADDGLVDNGYLAMQQDVGWVSVAVWVALWLGLTWMGVKTLNKVPGIKSAYTLSLVLGCAFSAVFMRSFQVFPFWVMISIVLSICLAWFFVALKENINRPKDTIYESPN